MGTWRGLTLLETCFAAGELSTSIHQTGEGATGGAAPQECVPKTQMATSAVLSTGSELSTP